MSISEGLIPELRHEASVTRKAIERVPADKFGWKPHEKSMTFGRLASHCAEIPGWGNTVTGQDEFKIESGMKPFEAKDTQELLKTFDEGVAGAIKGLEGASDEHMMGNWRMLVDGNEIISMPRVAVYRVWVLNHLIHHRGQLSVYLRENDIPVPAIYGPSADEQPQ